MTPAKHTVILKIPGGLEMKYIDGEVKNFDCLQDAYLAAIKKREGEIVFYGETFDADTDVEKLPTKGRFTTFLLFKILPVEDPWETLEHWVANWPELVFMTYKLQIIEMKYYAHE